jgi:AraC-like DNA-binding protein
MELKYKLEEIGRENSFYLRREHRPYLEGNWHCHEEFELMYVLKGEGIRIVGDNLSNFGPAELVLVGPWIPHLWKNISNPDSDDTVDIIVVKFTQTIGGQELFLIPEFEKISNLLNQSLRGLLFSADTIAKLHDLIIKMTTCEGPDKIINLLLVLKELSESKNVDTLASTDYISPVFVPGENRLSKIINFISNNFTEQINLEELAEYAAMTPSSLCRFFKSKTTKTVFQFVNEFRIGKACQMLASGNLPITEICYSSGFNSLTSFNRDFKVLKKVTPREYKLKYQILNK